MFNTILDFYGDNIQSELWQIEKIVHKFSTNNDQETGLNSHIINQLSFSLNDQVRNQLNWKSDKTIFQFFNRILDIKCIDSSIFDNNNNSIIMCACEANDADLIKKLLKLDKINVNLYDSSTGNTPLLVSLQKENYEITKLLINHPKTNINAKNFSNQTVLVIAVQKHMDTIVDLILKHDKFDAKESLLNYAYTLSADETVECFNKLKCIDVNDNSTFTDYQPLLIHAVQNNNKNMVELIINHPSFDKKKSLLYEAIFKASSKNEKEIFKILTKLVEDDFKKYKYFGKSILSFIPILDKHSDLRANNNNNNIHFGASNSRTNNFGVSNFGASNFGASNFGTHIDNNNINNNNNVHFGSGRRNAFGADNSDNNDENYILTEILNNLSLEFNEQEINECFNNCLNNFSSLQLKQLLEYDANHNHYINLNRTLKNGCLYLTQINYLNDTQIINFLLENGADPNIPDELNRYPLEIAILTNKFGTAKALIESNKIDYNKKIPIKNNDFDFGISFRCHNLYRQYQEDPSDSKYTTYLHLATESQDSDILRELLNQNNIDINMPNFMGDTPLMTACRMEKIDCIQMLYQKDNLDYLHQNKNGEDALEITQIDSMLNDDNQVKNVPNKEEYFRKLLKNIMSATNRNIPIDMILSKDKELDTNSFGRVNTNTFGFGFNTASFGTHFSNSSLVLPSFNSRFSDLTNQSDNNKQNESESNPFKFEFNFSTNSINSDSSSNTTSKPKELENHSSSTNEIGLAFDNTKAPSPSSPHENIKPLHNISLSHNFGRLDSSNQFDDNRPQESENNSQNTTGFGFGTSNTINLGHSFSNFLLSTGAANHPSLSFNLGGSDSSSQNGSSKTTESDNDSKVARFTFGSLNASNLPETLGNSPSLFGATKLPSFSFNFDSKLSVNHPSTASFSSASKNGGTSPQVTNRSDSLDHCTTTLAQAVGSSEYQKEAPTSRKKLSISNANLFISIEDNDEAQREQSLVDRQRSQTRRSRNFEKRSTNREKFWRRSRSPKKTRRVSDEYFSDDEQFVSVESEIAQQQLNQMIEIDNLRQNQFNEHLANQMVLMQSLQRKQKRNKKKHE